MADLTSSRCLTLYLASWRVEGLCDEQCQTRDEQSRSHVKQS